MVFIPGLSGPLEGVGKYVRTWADSGSRLVLEVAGDARSATCPLCGQISSRRHGRYRRWIADCPSFGRPVTLIVEIQRFKCANPYCSQRTFSERIEALAATGRRRTIRLAEALRALGYALGGQAAARLAARLGMGISGATVLRELRRKGCVSPTTISTVIGIDDWALARGHRYGTIVVDLERRRPIELLAERDGATVKAWLNTQPHIEIVARDRGGAYADAVRTAVPDAVQVADRWHLLANLRDAVERLLMRCASKLREAAQQQASQVLSVESIPPPAVLAEPANPILTAAQRHSKARRQHRLERYEEVVRRQGNGESIRAIGLAMDIDRRTVRGFVRAGSFPEQARRGPRASLLDAHRAYLEARIAAGCRNAMQVWRELRARGFTGGRSIVRAAFAQLRVAGCDRRPDVQRTSAPSARRACAWVLGWQERKLTPVQRDDRQRFVQTLCSLEPAVAVTRELALRLLGLVRNRDLEGFDRWLPQARSCAAPDLQRFAAGLEADLPAVRAAFSSPWSSGQVEGQINRLKYLKRQMYGRAKLDLLRIRVLHPN